MMNTRKHIVRMTVLGLVASTLAFAHPSEVDVGSLSAPSEMGRGQLAYARYQLARADAELESLRSLILICEAEATLDATPSAVVVMFDERGVLAD